MPVPPNIEKIHLIQAIEKIDREGVPPYRNYRTTACQYNGKLYPCKLIVSWANLIVNGEEIDNNPANFQTDMAAEFLQRNGFEIVMVANMGINNVVNISKKDDAGLIRRWLKKIFG